MHFLKNLVEIARYDFKLAASLLLSHRLTAEYLIHDLIKDKEHILKELGLIVYQNYDRYHIEAIKFDKNHSFNNWMYDRFQKKCIGEKYGRELNLSGFTTMNEVQFDKMLYIFIYKEYIMPINDRIREIVNDK